MKPCLMAVDVGTSACKVALLAADGAPLAETSVDYPVYYPQAGWAEQEPEDWWRGACEGMRYCIQKAGVDPACIAGVGVDGQSWACVPVDAGGNVLARTPIWMDTRAQDICAEVETQLGAETLFSISGNPFKPSYTTPKILWFARHRPQVYRSARYFLQCNSFIVYRLTGAATQDSSQGYGLHVFDMAAGRYDTGLCRALGIDAETLPPLAACHEVVGRVSAAAAKQTGLLAGTPVVAGGLDAACGTLGSGVCRPGQTQEQGGQAGGMSICMDAPAANPQLILSRHVLPGLWLLQGGTVGGGGSLKWLAKELGLPEAQEEARTGTSRFALLDTLAEGVPPGADGVVFLPYLAGERSPIWDPDATGVYFGIRYATTRAHFFRALMEGAAYALRHNLETAGAMGVAVGAMHAMGGAANSRFWTQMKADITGKTIRVPDSDLATCKGAAILAGMGTGVYRSFEEAVDKTVHFKREHRPCKDHKAVYDNNYRIYLELYRQLRPTMARAAGHGR